VTGLRRQPQILACHSVRGQGAAGPVTNADGSGPSAPARRRAIRRPRWRWLAVPARPGVARRYLGMAAYLAASAAAGWVLLPWLNPAISDTQRLLAALAGTVTGTIVCVLALAARSGNPTASRWLGRSGRMLPVIAIVVLMLAYSGGCHLTLAHQPTAPASTRSITRPLLGVGDAADSTSRTLACDAVWNPRHGWSGPAGGRRA